MLIFAQASHLDALNPDFLKQHYDIVELECDSRNFFIEIYDIARFSIVNRKIIRFELFENVSIDQALPFFYGSVLTVLLHMHMKFPLHASAITTKRGLSLFCAPSGTGKSTLALQLYKRGYPLFSDDKVVLSWNKMLRKYLSVPSIRVVRLWDDAIKSLDNKNVLRDGVPIHSKENKFQFNLNKEMSNQPQIVERIFIIHKVSGIDITECTRLTGENKVEAIKCQLHRPELIVGNEIIERCNVFIRNLSRVLPVFYIKRPVDLPILEFVDQVEEYINM